VCTLILVLLRNCFSCFFFPLFPRGKGRNFECDLLFKRYGGAHIQFSKGEESLCLKAVGGGRCLCFPCDTYDAADSSYYYLNCIARHGGEYCSVVAGVLEKRGSGFDDKET
jgi:hypothetical protein